MSRLRCLPTRIRWSGTQSASMPAVIVDDCQGCRSHEGFLLVDDLGVADMGQEFGDVFLLLVLRPDSPQMGLISRGIDLFGRSV